MNQKFVGPDILFSAKLESILQGKDSEVTLEAQNANLHFPELK